MKYHCTKFSGKINNGRAAAVEEMREAGFRAEIKKLT
jgi:hypothetical protein